MLPDLWQIVRLGVHVGLGLLLALPLFQIAGALRGLLKLRQVQHRAQTERPFTLDGHS